MSNFADVASFHILNSNLRLCVLTPLKSLQSGQNRQRSLCGPHIAQSPKDPTQDIIDAG